MTTKSWNHKHNADTNFYNKQKKVVRNRCWLRGNTEHEPLASWWCYSYMDHLIFNICSIYKRYG
uniref:Uncharacterized protein n=1 Tax=Arundo donax TaxID=35708 RepID=A0A0A9C3V4_ARUDO